MKLRRMRIEEEIVDISERLGQIAHLESTVLLDRTLAHAGVTHPPPALVPRAVEPHEGRIYVAAAHGQPRFKTVTWLHRTRTVSG